MIRRKILGGHFGRLRDLSANGQGTLSQSFGLAFAGGGSGIALRGLTVGGTLTLFNSERMIAMRRALLASAFAASFAFVSHDASAQQQQEAAEETPVLQEVVVTGSMIKRANAETAVPITILKADALKDQGITSVEQALDQLTTNNPQINIAQAVGTFSGGGSYADLRGLGIGRTLVLLDGQRMAPNAFSGNAVDISGIPFSAIDSVEVLRTGASSLYGSDAISGVINFITRHNFQGLTFSGTYDKPQQQGGSSSQVEGTFGHGDLVADGYNFMASVGYSKQNELQASARSFSAEGFDPARGNGATNNPGTWPGSVIDSNGNYFQPSGPNASGGNGFPTCAGNPELTTYFGNCAYRYSAATDLLPQHSELSALATLTKSIGANNSLQAQYFWAQSDVVAWSGPMFYEFQMDPASPYFPGNAQGPSVAGLLPSYGGTSAPNLTGFTGCPNPPPPAKPTCVASPVLAVWTDPNNNRYLGNLNTEQRALLTFAGKNAGWDYSTSINYSQNINDNRNVSGFPNESLLAPNGVLSDLINPFGPQSAAGQALINSSYISGTYLIGEDKRWSVDGHGSHELGDVISKGNPATIALGFSAGGERFNSATTPYNTLTQAATGLGDSSVEGSRTFQALFMELDVPLTSTLDLTLADRQDWYSDFGTTNNPKIQARWQPASFVTFRGTASTGFRAPTLFSLNNPDSLSASTGGSMGQGNPNCAVTPPIAPFTSATCATQGLGLFGGNPHLTPETSENFDLGVVLTPITDLGITLDYYRILVKNTISAVPPQAIYSNPSQFASYFTLNSAGGLTPSIEEAANCIPYTLPTCGYINVNAANTGRLTTSGIDLSIQYAQHTSIGTFREDLEGTAVTQFLEQQYNGGPELNLVGDFDELPPTYRWQHNLRVDWSSLEGMWSGGVGNRFYSSYIDQYQIGPNGNMNQIVGSYSVFDGYASVKPIKNLTVLFGIKNLFDKNPPYTNATQGNFAAGYNSFVVDPTQRSFYVNLKYIVF
jgi:iron complex outermembrane receptor protein